MSCNKEIQFSFSRELKQKKIIRLLMSFPVNHPIFVVVCVCVLQNPPVVTFCTKHKLHSKLMSSLRPWFSSSTGRQGGKSKRCAGRRGDEGRKKRGKGEGMKGEGTKGGKGGKGRGPREEKQWKEYGDGLRIIIWRDSADWKAPVSTYVQPKTYRNCFMLLEMLLWSGTGFCSVRLLPKAYWIQPSLAWQQMQSK